MKKFNFKYSKSVLLLLVLVVVLSAGGCAWNIAYALQYVGLNTTKVVTSLIICFLCAFLTVFALSALLYGKYVIKNGYLICYFGFIKSKINIKEATEITHFKKSDKLVLYYSNDKYSVIVIGNELYEDFILSIRQVNSQIKYDVKIEGEDLPE